MIKTTLQTKLNNNEAQYVKFVENIVVKLTENADQFQNIEPSLADLELAFTTFKKAQADASYRDKRLVVIKNQALSALRQIVYHMSLYVEKIALGDPAVILAAGFVPSKSGETSTGAAPKPKHFTVEINPSVSGAANLRVGNWKYVLVYQFEYRKKNSSMEWQRAMSSKSKLTINGLEPVQEYEFRVAYIGRNPQVTYSDIISSYVL